MRGKERERAGQDLFALDGRIASENLSVRATGLGDLGKRTLGPQGLAALTAFVCLGRKTMPKFVCPPPVKPASDATAGSFEMIDIIWVSFCSINWNEML